eukprot:CAMPEP_0202859568 /NCGR_PEP_ID=MMETSP1391-20130828/1621_1 /ASSEMBLY_ACC=CAM_ASM_000867 /TAXON_ID=1034604 /ORGANISM="Chlamydomonas leiostraca, Strain SAG 11-49" /LENGTH=71 /DNA_ID=CAMNT_0049538613 /DNA_START=327 /DNA_END=542 /DNA_ORIENTATION=+
MAPLHSQLKYQPETPAKRTTAQPMQHSTNTAPATNSTTGNIQTPENAEVGRANNNADETSYAHLDLLTQKR